MGHGKSLIGGRFKEDPGSHKIKESHDISHHYMIIGDFVIRKGKSVKRKDNMKRLDKTYHIITIIIIHTPSFKYHP